MSFEEESTKIEDIMESILSEDRTDVDLAVALEVAERVNQNKDEWDYFNLKFKVSIYDIFRRKIAVEILRLGLMKSSSQTVLNSVLVHLR